MSTPASAAPKKINLRRPDILQAVQAQVLSHYRSELVERIRANGGVISSGDLTVKLAKEFGTVNEIDCRKPNVLYVGEPTNCRVQKLTLHP